jgi:uncharacterized membrane protein (UPF0127 family)
VLKTALALALAWTATACGDATGVADPPPATDGPPATVTFSEDAVLHVEVADEAQERRTGLMSVEDLPADEGMAFVFDGPVSTGFWMKDTPLPLSIAFVGEDGRVVAILDMEPCEADPCPLYAPGRPYVLAVEANRGWFDDRGVEPGDRAELEVVADG